MVTIRDIARKMNLHYTTVAKALREHPDISEKTKEKVLAVAKELDYHPNLLARSFKRKKSNTIGIIVPVIKVDFAASIISGVEEIIYNAGYSLMICQTNESVEREIIHTKKFIENQVEGVIIQATRGDCSIEHLKAMQRYGIKVVLIDRILKDFKSRAIVVDDYEASFKMVERLIASGYKNIAHFGGPENLSVSINRRNGYLDALKKHAIAIDPDLIIHGGFYTKDGEQSMKALIAMNKKPDAVFCANDSIASGVYLALNSLGLKIPADVAVAGFGNLEISKFLNPPLTTVNQSPRELGKNAALSLIRMIQKEDEEQSEHIKVLKSELIIRQSI